MNINLDVHAGKPGTIQVFNALGELVTQERLIPGNLETHNMRIAGAAGVYTVVIQLDDQSDCTPGGGESEWREIISGKAYEI